MADSTAYFVRGDDGEEYGPVSLAELREWALEDRVGLGTSVRPDFPDSRWSAWQHYPELVALLAEVQAVGAMGSPVVAPLGRRSLAFLLDFLFSLVFLFPVLLVNYSLLPAAFIAQLIEFWQGVLAGVTPTTTPDVPLWYALANDAGFLLLPTLYFAGCYSLRGRTLGKWLLNLRVVDAQGAKPTPVKALVRALVFVISVYFCYGLPLIYAFFNSQRRALHDIAAGTHVVEL